MFRTLCATIVTLALGGTAFAVEPRLLSWEDLIPEAEPIENPFLELSESVRDDLLYVERIRADLKFGLVDENGEEHQRMLETEAALKEQGVDFQALERAAAELDQEIKRRNAMVVQDIDGEIVRMPGYALPLEASDAGVREFLLVPYVGACIHVPPPPPNQIVYVEIDKPYDVESLYEPIWITGRISIEQASRALSFVDGENQVATGYKISGISIEPYQ